VTFHEARRDKKNLERQSFRKRATHPPRLVKKKLGDLRQIRIADGTGYSRKNKETEQGNYGKGTASWVWENQKLLRFLEWKLN